MTLDDQDLFDTITIAALKGCDVDVAAHKNALWQAAQALMADVLRESDPFTRERLLRGLEGELRDSMAQLEQLLGPRPSPWPRMH